jgi:endogenous inhibitor of DNA gyrase (YacG/DUF329 family)
MGIVMLTCPETGKPVSTGLETDAVTFAYLPRSETLMMPCPACGGQHPSSEAWLDERGIAEPSISAA